MHPLARLDHQYVWHPFTQMKDWLEGEPIIISKGRGAVLQDVRGKEYLDANASIWTNLHGHSHPKINKAIQRQLEKISHSSALGFANEPATLLAEKLIQAAAQQGRSRPAPSPSLSKVFFSDDGSTAMEVALKLAYEFSRRSGRTRKPRFLSLEGAYHGDTVGAVSLGHIDLFHKAYSGLLFQSDKVPAPYCYRCPFNKAKPERADARTYRKCNWECLGLLEKKFKAQKKRGNPYAGFVFEPLMQGAAGMIPQPTQWLSQATNMARSLGALLIADEVMTGFGRTGTGRSGAVSKTSRSGTEGTQPPSISPSPSHRSLPPQQSLFACQHEHVHPDFMALAKGLTGGCLPMAATLTTKAVFDAFLGEYSDFKTFFHGHSYTGNQLGAAAGLASMKLLSTKESITQRERLEQDLASGLNELWKLGRVGDIRQVGQVVGIELVHNWRTREPLPLRARAGIRVCETMAAQGVLTRPIGNIIVLMPPYCTTPEQVHQMTGALAYAIKKELGR